MKSRPWPPLPKSVHGAGGTITVRLAAAIEADPKAPSETVYGEWQVATRTIQILESAEPHFRWLAYFHELVHAALSDSGLVHVLTDDAQEALCDALAVTRLREMRGRDL